MNRLLQLLTDLKYWGKRISPEDIELLEREQSKDIGRAGTCILSVTVDSEGNLKSEIIP